MRKFGNLPRWHKEILKTCEGVGLEISKIRQNGHIHVKGKLNGKSFSWSTSSTPSTQNAQKKMIADLKRKLKCCGVLEIPRFKIKHSSTSNPTRKPIPSDIWWFIRSWEKILPKRRIFSKSKKFKPNLVKSFPRK